MTEIYNGFRLIVVVIALAIIAWFVSQAIPQLQSAATLPAKVQAENALVLAQAQAAPTFIALQVAATRTAIENEALHAQSQANATLIHANASAESSRQTALTWNTLGTGALILAGMGVIGLFGMVGVRMLFADRAHQAAIREVRQNGGTLLLPNHHEIRFLEPGQAQKAEQVERTRQGEGK